MQINKKPWVDHLGGWQRPPGHTGTSRWPLGYPDHTKDLAHELVPAAPIFSAGRGQLVQRSSDPLGSLALLTRTQKPTVRA